MKTPRDVQTDTHSPNRRETASEQTVIIGEGGGGAQNSLAGSAASPAPPAPAPAPASPAPPMHREPPKPTNVIAHDAGHTRLLPYPGINPAADAAAKTAAPVVGWLVVVDGPGRGNFRPIYPGSNTIGRQSNQRIQIDFGDDSISGEQQAFLVYDGKKRQFQVVPNLSKPNLVHLNGSALLSNSELKIHDKLMLGNTTLLFVPLCGADFDWDMAMGK